MAAAHTPFRWLLGVSLLSGAFFLLGLLRPARADESADALAVFQKRCDDSKADRVKLRKDLLAFRLKYPGPAAGHAARLLARLPGPLDQRKAEAIPARDRAFDWQPKELVAVLGEHRGRQGSVVNALAYTPDGKTLVSAGSDGRLRLW